MLYERIPTLVDTLATKFSLLMSTHGIDSGIASANTIWNKWKPVQASIITAGRVLLSIHPKKPSLENQTIGWLRRSCKIVKSRIWEQKIRSVWLTRAVNNLMVKGQFNCYIYVLYYDPLNLCIHRKFEATECGSQFWCDFMMYDWKTGHQVTHSRIWMEKTQSHSRSEWMTAKSLLSQSQT